MVKTYKILGRLLTYPDESLTELVDEIQEILQMEKQIPKRFQKTLNVFLQRIKTQDLITLQEQYVALFDRTRTLSLHLFEHVYGESRDRGQAMVDLMNMYEKQGLILKEKELPDYFPLFLEFISTVPADEATRLLDEPINIIALLGKRLKQRGSDYAVIFDILEALSTAKPDLKIVENSLVPEPDENLDEPEKIESEWEEKPVLFDHSKLKKQQPFAGERV